jgi:2'-hydroxyisoflavone reductase
MKILIIGGTKFLGRHLIDAAVQNGHEVTLFNRGKKYADEAIPDVEQIHGDRNSDLEKLSGKSWDAVIDTCGYLPQTVKASAEFFKDKVSQYVFISSGSVYTEISEPNYDESTKTATFSEEQRKEVEKIDPKGELTGAVLGENYGALKRLCEEAAESAMPNRVLNVRAGMIVGAFDPTDRFTYWVMRVAQGGEVLAPGTPENPSELIDARDLSEWIIKMIEENESGIFNVTSKQFEITFAKMLEAMKNASGSDAEFVWADESFLTENNVAPWSDMPFYLPESDEKFRHFLTMNVDKALSKGLKFRPLEETVTDVLNWRKTHNEEMKAGISIEREKELLKKWHEQNKQ